MGKKDPGGDTHMGKKRMSKKVTMVKKIFKKKRKKMEKKELKILW